MLKVSFFLYLNNLYCSIAEIEFHDYVTVNEYYGCVLEVNPSNEG